MANRKRVTASDQQYSGYTSKRSRHTAMGEKWDVGKATGTPVPTAWGATLLQWSALLLFMAYLVSTSVGNFAKRLAG